MKKMKHVISFVAMLLMMVSMFSVFPAVAAEDEYSVLFNSARFVDPSWEDMSEGDLVTVSYQGRNVEMAFNPYVHFASLDAVWDYIEQYNIPDPVIYLNAGEYSKTIEIRSAVTLLGANAGIDPNKKSADKNVAWELSDKRSFNDASKETIIKGNVKIRSTVGAADIVLDGLAFADGSAILDTERDSGAAELTIKNSIFKNTGNEDSYFYGMYLRTAGLARTLNLQNLYITGQNYVTEETNMPIVGFISPYFVELMVDNVAYVENKVGFVAASWFAEGVSPLVKVSNSCFYNADISTPVGHIISIDNALSGFNFKTLENVEINTDVNKRPNSMLELKNNIFYNASALSSEANENVKGGIIHFQFVNSNSTVNVQGNYFYAPDRTTFMDSEFIKNSYLSDQSSCMVVENNWFIGAYKVPDLNGTNDDTYINMSKNYFARTNGEIVNFPVFTAEKAQRLIRTEFWVDMDLKVKSTDWDMTTTDWSLSWVDNSNYDVELYMYTDGDKAAALPIKFKALRDGLSVQLYKSADIDEDGIAYAVSDPISAIDASLLSDNVYEITTLYAQVTDPNNPYFTPIYTISVRNCGDLNDMPEFSEAFPGYLMSHPTAAKLATGTFMPYRWNGAFYKMTVGKNLFPTPEAALKYGYKLGQKIPTICLPAGAYQEELSLTGSCTLLGEKHGVNPNVKPYEYLTKENFTTSAWTLSPERSNDAEETIFYAPIRMVEGADDYVVTIDGIKMADGCSYIDDCARNADNITILKNIYAYEAVGGYDRNGSANTHLFNFYKAFGPVTDRCTLYVYDTRVDGLVGETLFGPYFEKLVVDGLYYANGRDKSYFLNNMQSRDIADPYYSLTNGYYYNNNQGQTGMDTFLTHDDKGSQAAKEKIIYNIDGNVFYNAFQDGRASMTFWWSGTNMSVHLFNNTFYSDAGGSFIAATLGGDRFGGDCGESDCSEILLMKGNRFITLCTPPTTAFTGPGTNFDWSGNYWAKSLNDAPYTPDNLPITKPTDDLQGHTYEEVTRFTIDYTYADWDMNIRQYKAGYEGERIEPSKQAVLSLTKIYDDAVIKDEVVAEAGDIEMKVYRHKDVSPDLAVYPNPATVGEFDTLKYYSDPECTTEITSLALVGNESNFYGVVYPYGVTDVNGEGVVRFKINIARKLSDEAKILNFYISNKDNVKQGGGLIDQRAKTILYESSASRVNLNYAMFELSPGAVGSGALYTDENCTQVFGKSSLTGNYNEILWYKVTPESGGEASVYKLTIKKNAYGAVAGISVIDGMNHSGNNTFTAKIGPDEATVTFKPEAYGISNIIIYNGTSKLTPDVDGSYTVPFENINKLELKAEAISGNDVKNYTLKFERTAEVVVKEEPVQYIYGIQGATPVSTGYAMTLGMKCVVDEIIADVAPGATYAVYEDYACTKKINGPITLDRESKIVYVKATSASGQESQIVRLTIYTSLVGYNSPTIKATYNNTTVVAEHPDKENYILNLPAGLKSVTLSGALDIMAKDAEEKDVKATITGGEFTFYADPQMKVEIDAKTAINLTQKVTRIYYNMEKASYVTHTKNNPDDAAVSPLTIQVNASTGLITINSDRSTATYSDKSSIPAWATPYVDYLNDEKHGIFMGDENKKLNASSNITRNEIATVATRVMGLDVDKFADVELNFADTVDAWAQPYVRAAVASGIINGSLDANTGKTYFNGSSYATREQVMKILVSVCMGNEGITDDGATYYKNHKKHVDVVYDGFVFADEASVSEWAVPYIRLAVGKYNLVGGSLENGKLYLNPLKNITRAEVIKMVACYMGA